MAGLLVPVRAPSAEPETWRSTLAETFRTEGGST